ncbi:MAG: hypothetical protein JRI23_19350 [Deltaproteobacteria bacterium]|nr:hypothetical protein [Deltaproteobacteria bacterium]MBW2534021.1 hypothetical protein [Deltaproteobacteria bacterium]
MARSSRWALLALLGGLLCGAPRASAAAPAPLPGTTHDFAYDGKDVGHPERAWLGRAYVPPEARRAKGPVPLVIFLHGLNAALIEYRWMGGGTEGDVRRIVGDLVSSGAIEPVVVAGPSSVVASQVSRGASWNHLNLDGFIDRTIAALPAEVRLDEARIVVAGHSGAGCSSAGGLATAGQSRRRLLALMSIDTCMGGWLAERLAQVDPGTHVVVSYQSRTWRSRGFRVFEKLFDRGKQRHPAADGVLRVVDHQEPSGAYHDATVALTFQRWLPKVLRRTPR